MGPGWSWFISFVMMHTTYERSIRSSYEYHTALIYVNAELEAVDTSPYKNHFGLNYSFVILRADCDNRCGGADRGVIQQQQNGCYQCINCQQQQQCPQTQQQVQ